MPKRFRRPSTAGLGSHPRNVVGTRHPQQGNDTHECRHRQAFAQREPQHRHRSRSHVPARHHDVAAHHREENLTGVDAPATEAAAKRRQHPARSPAKDQPPATVYVHQPPVEVVVPVDYHHRLSTCCRPRHPLKVPNMEHSPGPAPPVGTKASVLMTTTPRRQTEAWGRDGVDKDHPNASTPPTTVATRPPSRGDGGRAGGGSPSAAPTPERAAALDALLPDPPERSSHHRVRHRRQRRHGTTDLPKPQPATPPCRRRRATPPLSTPTPEVGNCQTAVLGQQRPTSQLRQAAAGHSQHPAAPTQQQPGSTGGGGDQSLSTRE